MVAWNTNLGGADLPGFLERELGLTCTDTGGVTQEGFAPFVMLLQEVFRRSEELPRVAPSPAIPWTIDPDRPPGLELDVIQAADRCGLALLYVPSARNGSDSGARPGEDKGNAILSSLPLENFVAIDLPFEGGRKVAVAADLNTPEGQNLRVASVHLDVASTLVRTLTTGNQTRVRQASGLLQALEDLDSGPSAAHATLVGGDFNTWSEGEAALLHFRRAFPDSPDPDGLPTVGPFPADHVFFRRSGSFLRQPSGYVRVDSAYHSDHRARMLYLSSGPTESLSR